MVEKKNVLVPPLCDVIFGPSLNLVICRRPYDVFRAHALLDEWLLDTGGERFASRLLPPSFGTDMRAGTLSHWFERLYAEKGQWFFVSMTPHVFDHFWFASAADVESHIHLYDRGRLSNMSGEDAADFFRAYKAGIQHVSEILLSRGVL